MPIMEITQGNNNLRCEIMKSRLKLKTKISLLERLKLQSPIDKEAETEACAHRASGNAATALVMAQPDRILHEARLPRCTS